MNMKLFLIEQNENCGYDTFDSAVVCAKTAKEAKQINPSEGSIFSEHEWTDPKNVKVTLIGRATPGVKAGVVCASFHAG
jgi:uracil DNA glycosylase